jgi:hypothetical protein
MLLRQAASVHEQAAVWVSAANGALSELRSLVQKLHCTFLQATLATAGVRILLKYLSVQRSFFNLSKG